MWIKQCHKPPILGRAKICKDTIFMVMTGGWFIRLFCPHYRERQLRKPTFLFFLFWCSFSLYVKWWRDGIIPLVLDDMPSSLAPDCTGGVKSVGASKWSGRYLLGYELSTKTMEHHGTSWNHSAVQEMWQKLPQSKSKRPSDASNAACSQVFSSLVLLKGTSAIQ